MPGAPAPFERLFVGVDGDAVEFNCAIDRLPADRNQASLPGGAEHEHVGGDRVAHERCGETLRVENERLVAKRVFQAFDQFVGVHAPVGIAGEIGGRRQIGGDHRARLAALELGDRFVARGDDEVAADQRVGFAGGDAGRMQRAGFMRDAHMRGHRAVLLA